MEQRNTKFTGFQKVRKYIPVALLILLTLALMLFFKYRKEEISEIFEEGRNNILAFYAENLKPLLFQTTITQEDVFNFALFNSLPLDKDRNKILEITGDQYGKNTFVIKTSAYNPSTKNYETFVNYMGMNSQQKERIDSILNSYKKEIYSSVLVNEKNTYAVNPKISELQQAVLADILSYARTVDKSKSEERFTDYFNYRDQGNIAKLIGSARDIPQNEYILITPDTVARTYFKWNQKELDRHLDDLENRSIAITPPIPDLEVKFEGSNLKENRMQNWKAGGYSYNIDSNSLKVVVPADVMNLSRAIQDSIRIKLNEAAQKMKNISFHSGHTRSENRKKRVPPAPEPPEIIINPFEIAGKTMEMLSSGELFSKGQAVNWE
ncbi:MAG: hypothetical protein WC061_02590, partial [Melioribacteraceae bacterium]